MSGGCTDEERGAPGLGRRPAHADDRRHAPHKFTAGHSPSWAQRWKSARVMLVPLVAVDGGESVPARDGVLLTRLMPNLASKGSALHGAGRTQEERRARRRRMQQKAEPATGGASRFWGGPCLRLRNEPNELAKRVPRSYSSDHTRSALSLLPKGRARPKRQCAPPTAPLPPACRDGSCVSAYSPSSSPRGRPRPSKTSTASTTTSSGLAIGTLPPTCGAPSSSIELLPSRLSCWR